jgi:hypothetical protein
VSEAQLEEAFGEEGVHDIPNSMFDKREILTHFSYLVLPNTGKQLR